MRFGIWAWRTDAHRVECICEVEADGPANAAKQGARILTERGLLEEPYGQDRFRISADGDGSVWIAEKDGASDLFYLYRFLGVVKP